MKHILLKIWIFTVMLCGISFSQTNAQNNFHILPELTGTQNMSDLNTVIGDIWQTPGSVMDKYREAASGNNLSFTQKMAGGIMSRNTLLEYIAYLIKFVSQLGLVIGALMIIYAWYQYATNIFTGKGENEGKNSIKRAIIGVVVISFSYAIMKFFTAMFLGT